MKRYRYKKDGNLYTYTHRHLMKSVKITAEITITPEMFIGWCGQNDYLKNEQMYKDYIKSWVHSKFSAYGKFFGEYENFINKTIPDNGNGLKIAIQEV